MIALESAAEMNGSDVPSSITSWGLDGALPGAASALFPAVSPKGNVGISSSPFVGLAASHWGVAKGVEGAVAGAGSGAGVPVAGGVGVAGGVHPVMGGASAGLACTIFSRFSRTLKLKRRRLGFPRRPPSGGSGGVAG